MLEPLHSNVMIQRDAAETVTKGGIVLPDSAQEKPKMGTVISVGPGRIDSKTGEPSVLCVQKGERVLFKGYAGTDVKVGKEKYVLLDESEILAVDR